MSEKKMTEERELKILERATLILGEYELLAAGSAGARALSQALLNYGHKVTAGLDTQDEREQVLKGLGEVSVWLNLLEMVVDDCTEQEIDYLEYLEQVVNAQVAAVIDVAKEIQAEDAAAEDGADEQEAQDGEAE